MEMRELPLVLQLDVAGNPHNWITHEKAAYYYTKDLVAWSMQAEDFTLHGGLSRLTGEQSKLTMDTIIAIKGKVNSKQMAQMNRVPLNNETLFRRDQHVCGYCGNTFASHDLSRDHILPVSRGGPNTWMNVVTACHQCNKHKDDRTPEEAGMELLFVPYVPNRAEYLILKNRKILADQMQFLLKQVPKESRLLV
jgi:hypothetical protein